AKTARKSAANPTEAQSASALIDARIKELGDWRGKTLKRVRRIITSADAAITEEVKWRKPSNPRGVPTWTRNGIICTGEIYKDKVKLTFAKGATLKDPSGLFNASLDGNARRSIDIREDDTIDEPALGKLVRAAVALNAGSKRTSAAGKQKALPG